MQNNLLAVLFALASALTIAWGTVVRHRIAEEAPGDGATLKDSPFWSAITRPLWWAGMSTAIIAYFLQTVALGFGTLLVVQPILVLKLMFTFPLSAKYDGRRITFDEMFWSAVLSVAVTVLVLLGRPIAGQPHPPIEKWIPAVAIGCLVLFAMDRYAHRQIRREKALILGLVCGAIFGYVAVFSKAVVEIYKLYGWVGLATNWELYALIIFATVGTMVQQTSFKAGALKNSLPAMTIGEPIVAFTLGYLVLGESFQAHGIQLVWMAIAFVAMLVSTFALSRRGVA